MPRIVRDVECESFFVAPAIGRAVVVAAVAGIENDSVDLVRVFNFVRPNHRLDNFRDVHRRNELVVRRGQNREIGEETHAVDVELLPGPVRGRRLALGRLAEEVPDDAQRELLLAAGQRVEGALRAVQPDGEVLEGEPGEALAEEQPLQLVEQLGLPPGQRGLARRLLPPPIG